MNICWPATAANSTLIARCPLVKDVFDSSSKIKLNDFKIQIDLFICLFFNKLLLKEQTFKYCTPEGRWFGYNKSINGSEGGLMNFKECLEATALRAYHVSQNIPHLGTIITVARSVEFVGLILSIICLCVSLFVFCYHDALRCRRTKIHINLFVAILLHILIRIVIYVDQIAHNSKFSQIELEHYSIRIVKILRNEFVSFD
jgi:hypothetical protein